MANGLTQSKWADHLRGCAEIANDIAKILDIREDSARQAMFATITIDAGKHNVFVEPIPEQSNGNGVKPDTPPQRATPPKYEVVGENLGALRNPTPEQTEGANRGALLSGINIARELLKMSPADLNKYIQTKMNTDKTLGSLDVDDLAVLAEKLSKRIDAEKKKPESKLKEHLMEKQAEKSEQSTNDDLEDWP